MILLSATYGIFHLLLLHNLVVYNTLSPGYLLCWSYPWFSPVNTTIKLLKIRPSLTYRATPPFSLPSQSLLKSLQPPTAALQLCKEYNHISLMAIMHIFSAAPWLLAPPVCCPRCRCSSVGLSILAPFFGGEGWQFSSVSVVSNINNACILAATQFSIAYTYWDSWLKYVACTLSLKQWHPTNGLIYSDLVFIHFLPQIQFKALSVRPVNSWASIVFFPLRWVPHLLAAGSVSCKRTHDHLLLNLLIFYQSTFV